MPRAARRESVTGFYHVVLRGNNKKYIFEEQRFKLDFYEFLCEQEKCGRIELCAWCIMDNHVHVILKAKLVDLSEAFKRISIKFAFRHNTGTKSVGHVYDNRFMSRCIETDEYLKQSVRYVHNNPVKAKMVEHAKDYKWSSYPVYEKYVGNLTRPQMSFVMAQFEDNYNRFEAWHQMDDTVEHLDIKEDLERFYLVRANKIIAKYSKEYGLYSKREFESNRTVMDKMIIDMIDHTHLPLRKIAVLLELPYSRVQRARRFEDRLDEVVDEMW